MLAATLLVWAALFLRQADAFQYKPVEVGQYLQATYNAFSENITSCPDPSKMVRMRLNAAMDVCFQRTKHQCLSLLAYAVFQY